MDRLSLVRYFAFATLHQLIGKRIEARVQFPAYRRDLQLRLVKLFELERKCVQIRERVDSSHCPYVIGRCAG